jgi:segregation and condensation protein B
MTSAEPTRIVEAALFSAGKPLAEAEIADATGLGLRDVTKALKALHEEYNERQTALEVARGGTKWAMQLKGRYTEKARTLAKMEVPAKVLKTLALIAFHQPIKQSELKEMVGSVVYDHVKELRERGMVVARQDGITKQLTTSPRFPEYFGLDASDRDGLRNLLAERVGIDPAKLAAEATPQTKLPQEEAAEDEAGSGEGSDEDAAAADPAEAEDPEGSTEPAEALKATTG